MDGPQRSGPAPGDQAGGHRRWRPALGYLAVAVVVVAAGAALMSASPPEPAAADNPVRPAPPVAAAGPPRAVPAPATMAASGSGPSSRPVAADRPAPPAVLQASLPRDPNGDLTPDLSDYVNKGEKPGMAEVIERLHQAGVAGGLGAFSPPGTRPPLVGLAVPEDFALPEGYVRHYQATDDGRRLEPILMFAPDARLFDAAQRPVAIPKDRVVPPELAPPGLPIRRIAIPAPAEPGR